ncbi:MAG: beta-galactosidase, partial [Verrucomicrobia bacterium]|nr:beta-galactosidase [Verrucomicrobiota bacterium]
MKTLLFLFTAVSLHAQSLRPWTDYRVILWMGEKGQKALENPAMPERLRELGINSGMVGAEGDASFYTKNGFGHYVENIVNEGLCLKWRSKVTDWDKTVTEWAKTRDMASLVRDYPLEDAAWLQRMGERMTNTAREAAPQTPLLYDLRDELSTTISANPFDYDFSPTSLAAFREWLKTRYASLEALNKQWETSFASWDAVMPFTTDQIKQRMGSNKPGLAVKVDWAEVRAVKLDLAKAKQERTRWNFAPWADHRSYMDLALARALEHFRKVSHEADPATPVGIEGTQMPHAFGGYDLWRMSQVLDWVEPYDICNSREIFGSFMPGKPILATVFEKDTNAAMRRLWHLLLEGDKGSIIWWSEDVLDYSKPDLPITAKGKALAPVFKSLTTPLAKLFMLAQRERDPLLIHYSQPSIQVAWLMESTVDGSTWLRRFSSYESDHNRHAVVRNAWLKALQDLGFSPSFISSEQLEKGMPTAPKLLVLPQSWAMSQTERDAARSFAKREQRVVIADGPHGLFDEHGSLRANFDWPASESPDRTRLTFGAKPGEQAFEETGTTLSDYAVNRLKADFDPGPLESIGQMLA